MWSQICGKNAILVHKVTLNKKCKQVKTNKNLKKLKSHFFSK